MPLKEEDSKRLGAFFSKEEMKFALFEMGPSKALRKDGYNAFFFLNQWDIVGDSLWKFVKMTFRIGSFPKEINSMLLVLISKVANQENFAQF